MSGGQKQRIFLARCLYNRRNLLLLDEPTSALDSKQSKTIISNLRVYCKDNKITLVYVTHDKSLANMADHQIKLSKN